MRKITPAIVVNMAESWLQYGGASRNFTRSQVLPIRNTPTVLWRRGLGEGTSGIVTDGRLLFTLYSDSFDKSRASGREVVIALEAKTGKTRWERPTPVTMLKGQESFTNDPIRPQATPLLWQGKLITLGFTGLLTCFEASSGRVLWERGLVKDLEATPVQFGFSSSPLLYDGSFIVHVGGKQAALVAFDPRDGKVRWKSAPAAPCYASPVLVRIDGEDLLIQLTRDALLGIAAKDGATRWSYPLPKTGLTNVPTPISLPGQRLLISGQGVLGTRLLQLTRAGASEVWANPKSTYFYCNWVATPMVVLGCNSSGFVTALRLTDGQELWKERGQTDANVLQAGDEVLFLRGDGLLTRARATREGLQSASSLPLLTGRCWTPPTLIDATLYARDNREILALKL